MSVYNILNATNLNFSDIRDTLNAGGGYVNNNMSTAFKPDANINPWSKWKPVNKHINDDPETPITLNELKSANYGIEMIYVQGTSGVADLISKIKANNNLGYVYTLPNKNFRLGDFRTYNRFAHLPLSSNEANYIDHKVKVGGDIAHNKGFYEFPIAGLQINASSTQIGYEELNPYNDYATNLGLNLYPAQYVERVDIPSINTWMTDKLCWWYSDMRNFMGHKVNVYTFYTTLKRTPGTYPNPTYNDIFIAIPLPYFQLDVVNEDPFNSQDVGIAVFNCYFTDATKNYVHYAIQFTAESKQYRGGDVNYLLNLECEGKTTFKTFDKIHVSSGTKSPLIEGNINVSSIIPNKYNPDGSEHIFNVMAQLQYNKKKQNNIVLDHA